MSTASADAPSLRIEVAVGHPPGEVQLVGLNLGAGATVADALRAAGVLERFGAATIDAMSPGIRGRACQLQTPLADGDRVELTRALVVDPKEARRLRYRRDGMRPQRRVPR